MQERLERFIRDSGAQLEDAFRTTGSPLPPEVSGEGLVRSFIDGSFERGLDEDTQRRIRESRTAIRQIIDELRSELPGDPSDPEFQARFSARMAQWQKDHPELQ